MPEFKHTPALLESILRFSHPYNLLEILKGLLECSDILLHKKDYDGHGWERLEYCHRYGKEVLELLNNNQIELKVNAAAPELLEALKGFIDSFYRSELKFGSQLMVYDKAMEAIKKATE